MAAPGSDAPVPRGTQWSDTYEQFLSRCRAAAASPDDRFRLVEEGFVSCRGTTLYGKHLLHPPESPAAASILFLQGFGDHCNSPYHAEQMLLLARMGYDVHAFDHESLGRSDDRAQARCFLPRFDDLADDAVTFATARIARHAQPQARLFIWGESMGGGLGFLVAQRLDVTGCILVAPMCKLQPGMQPGAALTAIYTAVANLIPRKFMPGGGRGGGNQMARRIARTARALGVPRSAQQGPAAAAAAAATTEHDEHGFQLPVRPATAGGGHSDGDGDSKALEDMSVWERQQLDVVRYQGGLRFGTALSILRTTQRIYGELEALRCPVLLMGGEEDPTCSPEAVRELYQRAASIDKEIVQYEGMGHIIMFTQGKHKAKSDDVEVRMRDWLASRNHRGGGAPTMWRYSTPPPPRPCWAVARRRAEWKAAASVVAAVLCAVIAWVRRRRASSLSAAAGVLAAL